MKIALHMPGSNCHASVFKPLVTASKALGGCKDEVESGAYSACSELSAATRTLPVTHLLLNMPPCLLHTFQVIILQCVGQ